MSRVELTHASEKYKGEVWTLKRVRSGLVLLDQEGVVVTRIPAEEVKARIELPSFLESAPFLVIMGKKRAYSFKATRADVREVKELIDDCVEQAPEAAAAECIQRAKAALKFGAPFLLVGILIGFGGGLERNFRAFIFGLTCIGVSLFPIGRATLLYFQAQSLRAQAKSNDDDDESDDEA